MLVLNRKARQRICIGEGLKNPNDNPDIVITVIDVHTPYVRIQVKRMDGKSENHNLTPLEAIDLGNGILMQVSSINFKDVKLAFDAPRKYRILRSEL